MALHRAAARPTAVRSLAISAAFVLSGTASIGFGLLFAARWSAVPDGGLGVLAQGRFGELVALASAFGVAVVSGYLCVIFLLLLVGDIAARAGRRLGAVERIVLSAAPPMLRATLATALGAGMILTVSTGGAADPSTQGAVVAVATSTGAVAGIEADLAPPPAAVDAAEDAAVPQDGSATDHEFNDAAGGETDRTGSTGAGLEGDSQGDVEEPAVPATDESSTENWNLGSEPTNDSAPDADGSEPAGSFLVPGGVRPSMTPIHVVRPGDSLWMIARDHLPAEATTVQVNAMWQEWYSVNRHVIGSDPGLLRPGTALHAPTGPAASDEHPAASRPVEPRQPSAASPSVTTPPKGSSEPDDRSDP